MYSAGCNRLIFQNKAVCLTDLSDLEYSLNWDLERAFERSQEMAVTKLDIDTLEVPEAEKNVLRYLQAKPETHVDELSRNTLIPVNQMANILLGLEFGGYIKTLPGKKYRLA